MTNNNLFFEKFQYILNLQKEREIQRTRRGENFNIFTVMKVSARETILHSALIAELLNPNGSHGLGVRPLELFLSRINVDSLSERKLLQAVVTTEHNLGPISEDHSTGGTIDILLEIDDLSIVIENKIYATDQLMQIFRYHNYCKSRNHILLYLTLDRHKPSEESLNGLEEGRDYNLISYRDEIAPWIKDCILYASSYPLVRETLQQYLKTILTLTNQEMDKSEDAKFFELMADYPEVVTKISDKIWGCRQYLVSEYFVKSFKDWCDSNNFCWYEDPDFLNQAKEQGFGIYRPGWNKMIAVEFSAYNFIKPFYGVWIWKSDDPTRGLILGNQNNEIWPYGWEYFDAYPDWGVSIAKELKSGRVFKHVLEKFIALVKVIDDNPDKFPMD